jgi:hypothetical protein
MMILRKSRAGDFDRRRLNKELETGVTLTIIDPDRSFPEMDRTPQEITPAESNMLKTVPHLMATHSWKCGIGS